MHQSVFVCVCVCTCVCACVLVCVRRAFKRTDQGPGERSFAKENDSSCLIQTGFVGEMSPCRIMSICSFEMFGEIKKMSGFCREFCINTMIMGSVFVLMPPGVEVSF